MGSPNIPDIECFWGSPIYDTAQGTWRCPDNPSNEAERTPVPKPVEVITAQPVNIFSVQSITDWARMHPFLVIGGLSLIGYILYSMFSKRRY